MQRYTPKDFNLELSDDDALLEFVLSLRYPDGITCRTCKVVRKHHRLTRRKAYSCDHCGTHLHPLVGTIFENSSTPLKSWFYAMHLISSTQGGVTAKRLECELGVTYKTAWRMRSRIRKLTLDRLEPSPGAAVTWRSQLPDPKRVEYVSQSR